MIKGNPKSLVALSFYKNYSAGFISNNQGTFYLGKLKENARHLIYRKENIKKASEFQCTVADETLLQYDSQELLKNDSNKNQITTNKVIRLYFETELDIYQAFDGSSRKVEEYITGLYHQVATLYLNEGINTALSEIRIWKLPDPYCADNTIELLNQFQNQYLDQNNTFNGDLAQLLTFRSAGGGRAAGFDGLCNTFPVFSMAISTNLSPNLPVFPAYSSSVEFVTHEFGHLLGSNHTHDCLWNGDNTAIDSCSGFTVGDCPLPGSPKEGGTIMSYCYNASVGIDFKLGFGSQPGNVIRDYVANASCLENTCSEDLIISETVIPGQTDEQKSSNTIVAINTILNGGSAIYSPRATLFLKPGFHTQRGSLLQVFIEGCSDRNTLQHYNDLGSTSFTPYVNTCNPNEFKKGSSNLSMLVYPLSLIHI